LRVIILKYAAYYSFIFCFPLCFISKAPGEGLAALRLLPK
jgi:hypothetical protein